TLPPIIDGVSRTLGRLFDFLESQGIEFKIYAPFKPDDSRIWSKRVEVLSSVPFPLYDYYRVSLPRKGLWKEVEDFKPDLIHSVSPTPCGIFGLHYARKHHLPAVTSYHTHFVDYFKHYRLGLFKSWGWVYLKWFHNLGLATYTPTPSTIEELRKRGFKNLELWSRGVDLDRFSPRFRDEEMHAKVGKGLPIILFVGRLVSEKDLWDLILADRILKGRGIKYQLVIAGDGPMKEELARELPEAHLTGMVRE